MLVEPTNYDVRSAAHLKYAFAVNFNAADKSESRRIFSNRAACCLDKSVEDRLVEMFGSVIKWSDVSPLKCLAQRRPRRSQVSALSIGRRRPVPGPPSPDYAC